MKKCICVIGIVLLILLTGCGIYDMGETLNSENIQEEMFEEYETVRILNETIGELIEHTQEIIERKESEEVLEIKEDTYSYCIEEIGVNLAIPVQLHVYETVGIRLDWNREWIHFPEDKTIIIAEKQYNDLIWENMNFDT